MRTEVRFKEIIEPRTGPQRTVLCGQVRFFSGPNANRTGNFLVREHKNN